MANEQPVKILASNRKAYHDYHIEDTLEAGVVLMGSEIKSIRAGQMNLRESYAVFQRGELWLMNSHVSIYDPASRENHEPRRERKLLLHRRQLNKLIGQLQEKGLTLIPLKVYLKNGRAKVELGLARGKKLYDKREAMKARDDRRQIEQALSHHQKGQ
jgi:SsrA-binding protein